jgi:hypothetical protein
MQHSRSQAAVTHVLLSVAKTRKQDSKCSGDRHQAWPKSHNLSPHPFITDDGIAAGLSQRRREFFHQPRCMLVDDDGDIPSFACPHPRFRNRYQRTVSLHSHRFTFLFRNNFKPHVNSPTLYRGTVARGFVGSSPTRCQDCGCGRPKLGGYPPLPVGQIGGTLVV